MPHTLPITKPPAQTAARASRGDIVAEPRPLCRDIIVIGASAGGIEPVGRLLSDLPSDLRAMVFIVLHLGSSSHLAEILGRRSQLPVHPAVSGAPIEPGHVHVAVPGCHLLLHGNHVLLRRGPRENLARPAIDPLFRSAACTFGGRVTGVVLSGALNDGTAGLRAIKRCGGLAVVQEPSDAAYPDMPLSALRYVDVDHVVPAREMGPLLARLAREPAGEAQEIPFDIRVETMISAQELASMDINQRLGDPSPFSCPECHGVLWEIDDGGLLRYRCHVGHAFTADAMQVHQNSRAEELLWNLLRNHQERAALVDRMAAKEVELHHDDLADSFRRRAHGYAEDAEIIRRLLEQIGAEPDAGSQEEMP